MRSIVSRVAAFFAAALIACIVIAAIAITRPATSAHASGSFSWSASADTIVSQWDDMDVRPMIVSAGSTFWIEYANGSNAVKRWQCTTLDSCTAQSDGVMDSSFPAVYGAKNWLGGAIAYNNVWYAAVHVEFSYNSFPAPNFAWFRVIGLATSSDQGAHWHYTGAILASDMSTTAADYIGADDFQDGPGDMAMFGDWPHGFVYLSFTTNWVNQTTGARSQETDIARCPISSIASESCWQKWYNGSFSQPGLFGHNTGIFLGEDNAAISYSPFLGEYVAIGHSTSNVSFISTATSMDSENWQPVQHFVNDSELYWYTWIVGTNGDPNTLSNPFRVYSSQNFYGGVATKYFTVTLSMP